MVFAKTEVFAQNKKPARFLTKLWLKSAADHWSFIGRLGPSIRYFGDDRDKNKHSKNSNQF